MGKKILISVITSVMTALLVVNICAQTTLAKASVIRRTNDSHLSETASTIENDDLYIQEMLVKYASSLAKVSYRNIKNDLDSFGWTYETTIGNDELATFHVTCKEGTLYIAFYPLELDDSAFGHPDKEMLSVIEYQRGGKWISVSDSLHINGGKFNTGDTGRDPVNVEVSSLDKLIEFYNKEIGGAVRLTNNQEISTDADRQGKIERSVRQRVEEYLDTSIERIDCNPNNGTSDPDDYLILIYLRWDVKNGVDRTRIMLEMYSDDMAASLAASYSNSSDIVLFWDVPYLLEKGTCAKYAYVVRTGKAYLTYKTGPLYS